MQVSTCISHGSTAYLTSTYQYLDDRYSFAGLVSDFLVSDYPYDKIHQTKYALRFDKPLPRELPCFFKTNISFSYIPYSKKHHFTLIRTCSANQLEIWSGLDRSGWLNESSLSIECPLHTTIPDRMQNQLEPRYTRSFLPTLLSATDPGLLYGGGTWPRLRF